MERAPKRGASRSLMISIARDGGRAYCGGVKDGWEHPRAMAGEGDPDPIDIQVGQRLRAFRLAKGVSQTKLAMAVGVTFQQIQKYEQGRNRISASMLCKLAKRLDINPAELFPPEECGRPLDGMAATFKTKRHRELMNVVSALDDEQAKMALRLLRAMTAKG